MSRLVPCRECKRHVRHLEPACPFCDGELPAAELPPRSPRFSRLGRAALFAFGATLGAVGCDDSEPMPMDSGSEVDDGGSGGFFDAYGAPPFDAGPPMDEDGGS